MFTYIHTNTGLHVYLKVSEKPLKRFHESRSRENVMPLYLGSCIDLLTSSVMDEGVYVHQCKQAGIRGFHWTISKFQVFKMHGLVCLIKLSIAVLFYELQ